MLRSARARFAGWRLYPRLLPIICEGWGATRPVGLVDDSAAGYSQPPCAESLSGAGAMCDRDYERAAQNFFFDHALELVDARRIEASPWLIE